MDLAKLINASPSAARQHQSDINSDKACLWEQPTKCKLSFPDDDSLYKHVTYYHIGRKKTENLCLSCHWKNCTVVCSKRDHITSHIKVHIPVKPFKCSKCPRSFKRAQDLAKHKKSHDDANEIGKQIFSRNKSISSYGSSPSISEASFPASSAMSLDTADENENDGYMSDPGAGQHNSINLQKDEIWQAKSVSKKRTGARVETLTNRFRSFENSLHFKKEFHLINKEI